MILISSLSLNFGSVNVGSSQTLSLTFTNDDSPMEIIDLHLGLDLLNLNHVFTASVQTFNVVRNGTYTINLVFKPLASGTQNNDLVISIRNNPTPIFIVPLSGVGVATPILSVANSLNFPKVYSNESSIGQMLVTNIGSANLNISSVVITSGSDSFRLMTTGTSIITPGDSKTFQISFNPKLEISSLVTIDFSRSGTVKITSDSPEVETFVSLSGTTGLREGVWEEYNLSTIIPKPLMDQAGKIDAAVNLVRGSLETVGGLTKSFKPLLIDIQNPMTIFTAGLKKFIDNEFDDIRKTGIYVLAIAPTSFHKDLKLNGNIPFEKVLASVGGGSQMFKQKIIDSFDDIYDGDRPQFSDSAICGAVVLAIDSGNFEDVIKGWRLIQGIFNNIPWKSEVISPSNVRASGGDSKISLAWSLPDIFSYDLSFGLSGASATDSASKVLKTITSNPTSFIDRFEVYSASSPNNIIVSDDPNDDVTGINKGDVYSMNFSDDIPTKVKLEPTIILASSLLTSALDAFKSNAQLSSSSPAKSPLQYLMVDSGRTNGETRYYAIRTVMKTGDKSRLSNEVSATPQAGLGSKDPSGLKKCAHLQCESVTTKRHAFTLPTPTILDITRNEASLRAPLFQSRISDTSVRMDRVYNFSLAERISTGAKIVEGAPKIDMTGITHENFDSFSGSDSELNDRKKQLFNHIIAPYASLIIGTEVEVIKISDPHHRGLEAADIKIIDVKDRGCLAGDKMVAKYRSKPTGHDYKCGLGRAEFDEAKFFDEIKCFDGSNKGICPAYSNRSCVFNSGTGCLNSGNTKYSSGSVGGLNKFKSVKNSDLYNVKTCQDGSQGGKVSPADRAYTNSSEYSIESKSGTCAGYVAIGDIENLVGQFPDWNKLDTGGALFLMPEVDAFLRTMQDFVDKQLGSIQSTSDTVSQFIDLFNAKLKSFQSTIESLDRILSLINTNYTGAGFNVLNIAPEVGGINRIKQKIAGAQGGPDSGINGFTAGIVILYGGDNLTAKFMDLIFGPGK